MAKLIVAISKIENGNMYIPDDPANEIVIQNRQVWLRQQGIDDHDTTRLLVTYDHSDFCRYNIVGRSKKGQALLTDGLVVTELGHALFLPVADCVATVFFDEENSLFMLSHLGRHSLEQNGGVSSVEYLAEHFGSTPVKLKVWLSPTPNKQTYPIFALDNKGMKEALYEQLQTAGVSLENIIDNNADTITDAEYFSHTAFLKGNKSEDGRFAMVAMMVED